MKVRPYSLLPLLPQTHPTSEPAGAAEEPEEQIWTHFQVSTGSPPKRLFLRLEHWAGWATLVSRETLKPWPVTKSPGTGVYLTVSLDDVGDFCVWIEDPAPKRVAS